MAYQKKYYFSFKDIRLVERLHLVELWQNTETVLVAEEIKGHMNPFAVEMPEIDHKFQVVRGSGCQINLLSATDMKFFTGLYHVNPTDFMVKHYIDGVINFLGYLNAEMMSEPYDIDFNYQVSLTGNDGFSLMDRFSFIQIDESNYTGIKSKFELLQIIFAKIGLPFNEYRIALSTTFTGYSGAIGSTILHESFIDCANFYDEDDKPMSLREVVDSIIAPYGAHIRAESGNIYITDIHSLASLTSVTYKQFTMSTGAYAGFVAIPNVKAVSDIGYLGTGHSIERSGGVNRQVVSYSPYPTKTILEESLVGIDEFTTVPETWSEKDGYYYKTLLINKYWEINPIYDLSLNPPTFEESYFDDNDQTNIYLRYPRYGGINTMIASLKMPKYVSISGYGSPLTTPKELGVAFKISGDILVKTKDNPYDEAKSKLVDNIRLSIRLKIAENYYTEGDSWTEVPTNFGLSINFPNATSDRDIGDRFVPIRYYKEGIQWYKFPISGDKLYFGDVQFEVWSEYRVINSFPVIDNILNDPNVKEIWLKNISIELVSRLNTEIPDNDTEYIGLLDRTFQNEGEKISLTCGTDTQYADRGKIMKSDGTNYSDILEWTRNAQTFKIEELLLGSVSSNYRAGFITLMNMRLKNSFSLQNILTDTFIGAAKMMVKSANINYQDNVFECSLIEILPDELIIVKDVTVK